MAEITHDHDHTNDGAAHLDDHDQHALHSDTVHIAGREITMPGGLYTLVFVVLAVVTIIEVALAESPLPNPIAYPILAALSIGKAVLVVLYYMHLMQDSRIFAWAFGIPLVMASVIVMFVMFVQPNMSY
ncbi:MAG: cytochrome C oxidase subunit IV family protein [Chloroflexota bacterium]